MRRGRMAYRMWAHALSSQARHRGRYLVGIPCDQGMNAEPRDWLATPIEKNVLRWCPPCDPRGKLAHRVRPQWATAALIALAPELYKRVVPLRHVGEMEVVNPEL